MPDVNTITSTVTSSKEEGCKKMKKVAEEYESSKEGNVK